MDKRNFIKTLSLGALSTPIYTSALSNLLASFPDINTGELSTNEDFWKKIRQDYRLKPDYINLESGYYNIIPKPTLNAMIDHARMVNYEGSYYMRTVQWENKKRMTGKLAEVAGCSPSNVVITRNTTESLDMVIKGMDWKAGDEAIMAIQDYGAMRDMFKQVARRFGIVNKVISIPNHPESDDEIVSLYENAITPNTKLLMVCHMINITGQILPIRKICDMAHAKGVK
ncbi:MAG: aminotransferase class V-fold PLP-dependent enzyme, partial [Bacteroidia bacterium]|nr:aminotransferase class V-fold PLP-dependent enzyme [Bacteroidia bacterium]